MGYLNTNNLDIPSDLIEYIAWDKFYNDMQCNSQIREVIYKQEHYILLL